MITTSHFILAISIPLTSILIMVYLDLYKPIRISIKKTKDCIFSRRNGYEGYNIFGYNILIEFRYKEKFNDRYITRYKTIFKNK